MDKQQELEHKVKKATKWSTVGELLSKCFVPVLNMILARLITPNEFGFVASITLVITLAELFSDAGFQKYIIQEKIEEGFEEVTYNTAFTADFILALVMYGAIFLFRVPLATLLGGAHLATPLAVAGLTLPLLAFSSIQGGLLKKQLNYSLLAVIRVVTVIIPFFVTVPLALAGFGLWSLIIGTLVGKSISFLILFIRSTWRPHFQLNRTAFSKMVRFSAWSMGEAFALWGGTYVGVFLLSIFLGGHFTGLYKVSLTTAEGILATIYAPLLSVMYATLVNYHKKSPQQQTAYFDFVKKMALILLPLGAGIFLYQDFVTSILLGSQWQEAAGFIGIWGLVVSLTIVYGQSAYELYRACGNAKIPFLIEGLYVFVLVLSVVLLPEFTYQHFILYQTIAKLLVIVLNLLLTALIFKINPFTYLLETRSMLVAAGSMYLAGRYLQQQLANNLVGTILGVFLCIIIYFGVMSLFHHEKIKGWVGARDY
jgi:PST family polysaccharide transporter